MYWFIPYMYWLSNLNYKEFKMFNWIGKSIIDLVITIVTVSRIVSGENESESVADYAKRKSQELKKD